MKKITAMLLSVMLAISMMPAMVFAGEGANSNTYDVNSLESLNAAITVVNTAGANSSNITINVTGDITVSSEMKQPDQIAAFSGKLIGNGHVISGLKQPMFGTLNTASVSGITLSLDSAINGPALAVSAKNSKINGVRVTGSSTAKIIARGAVVGTAGNTEISNCTNNVIIESAEPKGNIVGTMSGGKLSGCGESSLPTAGSLSGNVTADAQNFKNQFEADNLVLTLNNGSSVTSMVLSPASTSLSVAGGTVSSINTGVNTVNITLSNTTVTDILALSRTSGYINLYVKGAAVLKSITAGTVSILENSGDIQKVTVENAFFMNASVKLPSRIEKYGAALPTGAFAGSNYTGPTGSNPYVYTSKYAVKIGSASYGTLGEAFTAAKNKDVITLLENVNVGYGNTSVPNGKNLTLDLNGHTLNNGNYINIAGTLTVKDSSSYSGGSFNGLPVGAARNKLMLQSGKFNFDPSSYLDAGSSSSPSYGGYYTVTRNISYCNASVPNVTYAYNGTAQKPTVAVTDTTGSKLTEGYDYTVSYANNINVGTATVTIYGKNTYTGTKTITFKIGQKAISAVKADPLENQPYTGYQLKPTVILKDGTYTLKEGVDYTLSYGENKTLGATGTVTVTGKGNYVGSTTLSFKISKDISICTFSDIPDMDYTGYQLKPTVTVYDGTLALRVYSDYKITYGANVQTGTGSVVITGTGNYGGTKTLYFNIKGVQQKITTRWNKYSKTPASARFNLGAAAQGNAKLTYTSLDPSIVTVDASGNVTVVDTGIAKILIKAAKTGAYPETEKYVTVTVKPSKPVIEVTSPEKKKASVEITKGPGVGRYQIRYGRKGKYYNKYVDYEDTSDLTQIKEIGKLKSGQKYFIKVRAYKKTADGTVWGAWTSTKAVKIK